MEVSQVGLNFSRKIGGPGSCQRGRAGADQVVSHHQGGRPGLRSRTQVRGDGRGLAGRGWGGAEDTWTAVYLNGRSQGSSRGRGFCHFVS